jgi:hypothetical protein
MGYTAADFVAHTSPPSYFIQPFLAAGCGALQHVHSLALGGIQTSSSILAHWHVHDQFLQR